MLVLDCARIDQKCPKFPFANVGGDSCDVNPAAPHRPGVPPHDPAGGARDLRGASLEFDVDRGERAFLPSALHWRTRCAASTPMIYGPTSSGWAFPPGGIRGK